MLCAGFVRKTEIIDKISKIVTVFLFYVTIFLYESRIPPGVSVFVVEKNMICRRFTLILLGIALFCGVFAPFSSAEVVQAYRTPSESDLQWLLGNSTAVIPSVAEPSPVVQAVYIPTPHVQSLVPHGNPCRPVGLPEPLIPPAPTMVHNRTHTGLVTEEAEGAVTMISSVPDSTSGVVQMSGERLAPPAEIPREPELVAMRDKRERFFDIPRFSIADTHCGIANGYNPCDELSCGNSNDTHDFCTCFTCIVCGEHCKHKCDATVFYVPDMIGSSAWLSGYYVGAGGSAFTSPTMLLSRPNAVEHFNADVQNRIWADYRHWNNAVSFQQENRAVEQYSFGLEKKILKRSSIELRVPLFYQYGSHQSDGTASVELGNISVFAKQILRQGPRWTFVGGVGSSLPTAENWRPGAGVLKNESYYLAAFLGAQWHPNNSTFGHFVVQADVPIEKNELIVGSNRVKVDGQQVIRTGIQLGRWIYRADHGKRPCRFGAFAEVDYAVVTDKSAYWTDTSNAIYVNADARKSTLTAAVGIPMVFGKLTCMNALILPMSENNRSFSAAYSFSLSRHF